MSVWRSLKKIDAYPVGQTLPHNFSKNCKSLKIQHLLSVAFTVTALNYGSMLACRYGFEKIVDKSFAVICQ